MNLRGQALVPIGVLKPADLSKHYVLATQVLEGGTLAIFDAKVCSTAGPQLPADGRRLPSGWGAYEENCGAESGQADCWAQRSASWWPQEAPLEADLKQTSESTAHSSVLTFCTIADTHAGADQPVLDMLTTKPVKVLVDTGADANFVSAEFCLKNNLPMKRVVKQVNLANGKQATVLGTLALNIDMQSYHDTLSFMVINMVEDFNMILGTQWMAQHGAGVFINEHGQAVCLLHDKHWQLTHSLTSTPHPFEQADTLECPESPVHCKQISLADLEIELDTGDALFLVSVTQIADNPHAKSMVAEPAILHELDKLTLEYADVFADTLPPGLPPDRHIPPVIQEKPDSQPISILMYRLSQLEKA